MKKRNGKYLAKGHLTIQGKNALWGYTFILPWIIGFLIFTAFPLFYSIFLSLNKVSFTTSGVQSEWIGMGHYIDAFTKDTEFTFDLGQSLTFIVLSVPMIIVFSIIIAMLLNKEFRGRTFFRAVFFLPVIIISGPVISELMTNNAAKIMEAKKYVVYKFFATLGNNAGAPVLYIFDNLVLILWFSGVQILIFLAGLQKINLQIYEAAQIDGGSPWVIFWKITLPMIKPMILVNTLYTIVELSSFANNNVNKSITRSMFEVGRVYSYSAALAWIYFIAVLGLLGIALLLLRNKE